MAVISSYQSKKLIYHHSVSNADEPEFFTLHTHSVSELMFFVRGRANQVVEDRLYELRKNDLVYVKPTVHHRVDPDFSAEYERYVLMFDPEIIKDVPTSGVFENTAVVNCSHERIVTEIFKKFDYYCLNFPHDDFYQLAKMLVREIFFNLSLSLPPENRFETPFSPILSQALQYINANLYTIKSVSEISDRMHITESYLYSLFRQQLRTTPKKYISDKRLLAARKAIILGKKPTEVYQEFGFSEYSTFYRSFVGLFGYPPSKKTSSSAITVVGENRKMQ